MSEPRLPLTVVDIVPAVAVAVVVDGVNFHLTVIPCVLVYIKAVASPVRPPSNACTASSPGADPEFVEATAAAAAAIGEWAK